MLKSFIEMANFTVGSKFSDRVVDQFVLRAGTPNLNRCGGAADCCRIFLCWIKD